MIEHRFRIAQWLGFAALVFSATAASAANGGCPESTPDAAAVDDDCVPTRPPGVALAPDLSVLKSPDNPAFAALDLTPTLITRPGTPTGAALSLASGIVNGFTNPGQNVALDISPYWLLSHPTLTAKELDSEWYLAFYRRFSLSFASSEGQVKLADATGTLVDTKVGRTAVGAHTTLLPGHATAAAIQCGKLVDTFIKHDSESVATAKRAFVDDWIKQNPQPPTPGPEGEVQEPDPTDPQYAGPAGATKFAKAMDEFQESKNELPANRAYLIALDEWAHRLDAATTAWRKALDETPHADVLTCMDVMHHREGWMLDVAGAEVFNFPNNDVSLLWSAGSHSLLLWATGAWTKSWGPTRPGGAHAYDLSILGLAKISWDQIAHVPDTHSAQLGGRVVLAVERFGFSVEGLGTAADGVGAPPTTYRVAGVFEYHLKSGMWVALTGGANLDDKGKPTTPVGLANFQANFGHERFIAPDTTVSRPTGISP
jgi:hypothetical protein